MKMIDLYIQEVTRRLPDKKREDIALELRSTIEDMLPDDFTEQDLKSTLAKLGNPAKLASGYLDRPMHLIGPQFFGLYINLLKMIVPIAVMITLISIIANNIVSFTGEEAVLNVILDIIGVGIWQMLSATIQVWFWLTLVFAIIERIDMKDQHLITGMKEWTPDDLKEITYIAKEKAISKVEVFVGLLWTAIWVTVYFYASSIVGIYEKGQDGLEFITPTFNHEVLLSYWPFIVILVALEIAIAIWKLTSRQWTIKLAIFNVIYQLATTIVFILILCNPNLFRPEFSDYMTNLFKVDNLGWGIIFLFILFAVIESYQGFKKARIRSYKKD